MFGGRVGIRQVIQTPRLVSQVYGTGGSQRRVAQDKTLCSSVRQSAHQAIRGFFSVQLVGLSWHPHRCS